jgi:hypothetical protein
MRWLVALFLLTNIAFAQSQQQVQKQNTPAANSSQQTETDKRGTAQEPIIVKILPTQKSQAEADKEEHEKAERAQAEAEKSKFDAKIAFETQRIADYTDRLAWFTLGLIVVAVGQAALFGVQLFMMSNEVKRSKETFIAEHRPWVSFEKAILKSPIKFVPNGLSFTIRFDLKNIGSSPAIGISTECSLFLLENGVGHTQAYAEFVASSLKTGAHASGTGVVFPGQPTSVGHILSVGKADIDRIAMNRSDGTRFITMAAFASVTYRFQSDNSVHQTANAYVLPHIVILEGTTEANFPEDEIDFFPFMTGTAS